MKPINTVGELIKKLEKLPKGHKIQVNIDNAYDSYVYDVYVDQYEKKAGPKICNNKGLRGICKMGVLACDRAGCQNIMCDRYSHKYGYICWECFNELLEVHDSVTIAEFMESEKGSYNYKESDEYIYEVFELR